MFFQPQVWNKSEARAVLSERTELQGFDGYAQEIVADTVKRYGSGKHPFTISAKQDSSLSAEGYAIHIDAAGIDITHADTRGLIYAAVTLRQLAESNELFVGELSDAPDCPFRGYRAYLPGRSERSVREFHDMVDFLVDYKYNHLSLEIGGAMEYKRHPEINEKWAEFAAETHRYSDRAHEIQNGSGWAKNSIHTDNAEGDILTQDEVKKLIAYCRARGLEVYPEVPTLSHCDYLCMAHPEIAERREDPYPDTYCPSNPRSYELVFDVLDEVIEVFQPTMVNIGHDEYASICLCERCKAKKPQDVFTEDTIRIHDYLAARGIRTVMWADKLLPVVTKAGKTYGGSEYDRFNQSGSHIQIPSTYTCQSKLPRDILMLHWYACFGMQYDLMLHMHGYPTVFANLSVGAIEHWRIRRSFGLLGGICSNWGSNAPEYMQRNCQYFNLAMSAYALWSRDYDSPDLFDLRKRTFEALYRRHFGDLKNYIEVTHTTKKHIPYRVFYDGTFIEDDVYRMGHYLLTYTDGTTAEFAVKYGLNISSDSLGKRLTEEYDPTVGVAEDALGEISYSAIPTQMDDRTFYRTAFCDPYPEKTIRSFAYVSENADVEMASVTFHRHNDKTTK